ncbi:Glycosyltransferase involved in cell wall bisynthesis [Arboricoccus pini]|uniref:Glycosyltransferase involved in cell wall bisynthesis n=1 Tax=Arboricoccus pini TaxID=1963835 RepID=A0A212Q167_9PROT|nr:glycosyltransferase family 4 protein [Arboricoccus pini]SNB53101.1 Glycosyltransferase involved in cell wall bisynthesis [Arboricoccus pini]
MRIAFYAPLKAPDHPVVSGDRAMARALMALLVGLDHEVSLASRLRLFDKEGDEVRQRRLERLADRECRRYLAGIKSGRRLQPDLWFTYHGYHKAPDLLGPVVTAALRIPYVMAEASIAAKQADGPWARGHATTLAALRSADGLLAMTEIDRQGLAAVSGRRADVVLLRPFLDRGAFQDLQPEALRAHWAERAALPVDRPWLLAVAMMRDDVKRRSFEFLATALAHLRGSAWHLVVAGDGPARPALETAFAAAIPGRHTFLGTLPRREMPSLMAACDLLVWPALNEAYGMAMLEAAAAGLAVVAGRHGGVADIVADGETGLLVDGDQKAFAAGIKEMLDAPSRRRAMGEAAKARVASLHGTEQASATLALVLARAVRAKGEATIGRP